MGGPGAYALIWNVLIIMSFTMVAGYRIGIMWTVIIFMEIAGFYVLDRLGFIFPQYLTADGVKHITTVGSLALISLILIFTLL
jgi:hypothetical protein